ncbi:hypothetical protein AVEN_129470-1, partial [Araneus ventricosus]
ELYHRSTDPCPLKERLERVYSDPDRRNGSARIRTEPDGPRMDKFIRVHHHFGWVQIVTKNEKKFENKKGK